MANDQAHDTRTTVAEDRVAAAVSLSVAGVVATPAQGALTALERRFTSIRNFEGTVGLKATGADAFDGDQGQSTFTTEQVYSGTTAGRCFLRATDHHGGFGNWGGRFDFPNKLLQGDELFIRWRMYYPAGFKHYADQATTPGDRIKFMRVKSVTASGGNAGLLDLYWDRKNDLVQYKTIKEISPNQWKNVSTKAEFPHLFDQWVTYNVHYIASAVEGEGRGRFWRNGELMNDIQMQTLSSATDTLDWIYLFSYWNGDVPQAQHCYTDDWKITSDRNETVIDPVTGFPWIGV